MIALDAPHLPTYPDLRGKVAALTGAGRGIGSATAQALARNGVAVAVNDRDEDAAAATVALIRDAGGTAIAVAGDAADPAVVERLRARAEGELGPVGIVMPFAGGFWRYTPIGEIDEAEWRHVVDQNLTSTFLALRTFLPPMRARRSGAIVTMGSNSARLLDATLTASYAASKAAVVQLTRHVAREVGPDGVRVNCIAPATTVAPRIMQILDDDGRAELAAKAPLGGLGRVEDAACAALFLASASAGWLTGVVLDVAGGRVMA